MNRMQLFLTRMRIEAKVFFRLIPKWDKNTKYEVYRDESGNQNWYLRPVNINLVETDDTGQIVPLLAHLQYGQPVEGLTLGDAVGMVLKQIQNGVHAKPSHLVILQHKGWHTEWTIGALKNMKEVFAGISVTSH